MAKVRPIIMIIHDDEKEIKYISSAISQLGEIRYATNPEDADKLWETITPTICLTNAEMKKGEDLYIKELTAKYQDSIHIVITDNKDSKEIVSIIRDTKAFVYLNKPFNDLNIFQVVVVCFINIVIL